MRVLAVDLGRRRIGFALSDRSATLARPWETIGAPPDVAAAAAVVAARARTLAAGEDGLGAIVVALPRHLDGRPHEETERALAFAQALRVLTEVEVVLQDERLTSREAESRLAVREKDWRRRKLKIDAAAAAVVLQDYLDQRTGTGG